jgi:hypothetical protein
VNVECAEPLLDLEDPKITTRFLTKEVVILYNSIIQDLVWDGEEKFHKHFWGYSKKQRYKLTVSYFLEEFIHYFQSNSLNMTFLFFNVIWLKSVVALQDYNNLFLSKTVYLCPTFIRTRGENARQFTEDFQSLMKETCFRIPRKGFLVHCAHREHFLIEDDSSIQKLLSWTLMRNNPYLAGCFLLDRLYEDHGEASSLFDSSCILQRCIPLLYRVFRENNVLSEDIPVLKHFCEVFDKSFCPSKGKLFPKPVHLRTTMEDNYSSVLWLGLTHILAKLKAHEPLSLMSPENVSKVLSATVLNDFSLTGWNKKLDLYSSSFELIDFMVKETDYELFESRYLSMDLLGFFKVFIWFYVHLMKQFPVMTSLNEINRHISPIQAESLQKTLDFGMFAKYLFLYFDTPVKERKPADTVAVSNFVRIFKEYFSSLKEEDLFIIHERSIQDVYNKEFGASFNSGLHSPLSKIGADVIASSKLPKKLGNLESILLNMPPELFGGKEGLSFLKRFFGKSDEQEVNSPLLLLEDARKALSILELRSLLRSVSPLDFFSTEGVNLLKDYFSHDVLKNREMGEWLFVMYGCRIRLHPLDGWNLLKVIGVKGISWSFQLLLSIMPSECVHWQEENTGDTICHILAKNNRIHLLQYLLKNSYVTNVKNNDKQTFDFYLSDPEMKKAALLFLDDFRTNAKFFRRKFPDWKVNERVISSSLEEDKPSEDEAAALLELDSLLEEDMSSEDETVNKKKSRKRKNKRKAKSSCKSGK